MINFDQIKKNQKFSFQQLKTSPRYKLMFKRLVKFGEEKTLLCKVMGKPDWYEEVHLTQLDFHDGKAKKK